MNSGLQDVLRRSTNASESSGIDIRVLPRELQVGREGDKSRSVRDCRWDRSVPVRVEEGLYRPRTEEGGVHCIDQRSLRVTLCRIS